jgi:hypothetical protein
MDLVVFRHSAAIGDVDAMMYLGLTYGTGREVDYAAGMSDETFIRASIRASNEEIRMRRCLCRVQGSSLFCGPRLS